ncbi:tRNA uridine-5-carboxymethylaminomethyl(34) synthesis GTPase MnmE [Parafilimonas terrae]|uniref:tRNA modification GTPase MnmE n=1 Tax=Parafilimonas terrae TaxID=1465490 RepID=A0A1I5YDB4_9BACT|nr:tRNA uridine-5-carboxymethylaminomethyl(34) synthesis GTPase MnmE [Parafilimonas terrae]SFQ42189.1 tRNA modification GTPase trmE [Parafilimonas terrae]
MYTDSWNDTIIALATPQGVGAIGVIRLSGSKAIEIVNTLFVKKDLSKQASHTLHVGILKDMDAVIDEVVVSLFISPHSYTGENVVEISCHGSAFIQQKIIDACIEKGARLAKPGEFTQRAFLNGKLDLTQAEAVADLIASNTEASRKTALQNMRGGFSGVLKNLREQLLKFSALIELELDFSQEDVEFADRTQFYELITSAEQITRNLLQSFKLGNVIRNGVQVAIIGKPNAGKSTLLNTLLNENRAIVSDIAGTTRDTIEEVINIEGILFRLIDTAGIRTSDNEIESIGVEKSLEKMRNADIVIYMFDCAHETKENLLHEQEQLTSACKNHLLIGNKLDLMNADDIIKKFDGLDILFISAKEHTHVNLLKKRLVEEVVTGNIETENVVVTNARHYEALQKINDALIDIRKGMDNKIPGDLIALDIRRCLHYLGEITGLITNEDQLDYIFSKFCIGK